MLEGAFDIHKLFTQMESEKIIFAYKGDINQELLSSIFQVMDNKLEQGETALRIRKKFNNILIECLQNVYHHMQHLANQLAESGSAIFVICRDHAESYRIITGNYIENTRVVSFKESIDIINGMTEEELKNHYRESLSKSEFSEKGGAGLGMIDIARKSGHKLEYRFDQVNNTISFFSLIVKIT